MKETEGGSILIVDDDPQIVKYTASYFENRGMNVLCATNGEEAIRVIRGNSVVLMITDLHMPGMDGFELAGEVRDIDPQMKVLMVTGAVSPEVIRRAREAGIARVFGKPFRLEEVFAAALVAGWFHAPP
jgi:CheY-like chemotaxis protein